MNTFEPLGVEETRAITNKQYPISISPWHCEVPAGGNRLRTVTNHLSAFKKLCNKRVRLVTLELCVRIQQWIFVIESSYVANVDDVVLHAVDPTTTICLSV
jgi:hypothetical protein